MDINSTNPEVQCLLKINVIVAVVGLLIGSSGDASKLHGSVIHD